MADDEKPDDTENTEANGEDTEPELDEDGNPIVPEGGGGKKKLFIIVGAVLVLLIGGGAGAYFMGFLDGILGKDTAQTEEGEEAGHTDDKGDKHKGKDKKGDHDDGHGEEKSNTPDGITFLEMPAITVGLLTDDGSTRFLRLKVQLELESDSDKDAVEAIMPRVVDQFQTYLRELRVRDLRGSSGMYRLQIELLRRVNRAAAPVEVKDVLFQEMLIQ